MVSRTSIPRSFMSMFAADLSCGAGRFHGAIRRCSTLPTTSEGVITNCCLAQQTELDVKWREAIELSTLTLNVGTPSELIANKVEKWVV